MTSVIGAFVALLLPPVLLIVVRKTHCRDLGRVRHYALFGGCGLAHGLGLWTALLWSEWRPGLDWMGGLLVHWLAGGMRFSAFFVVAYLGLALLVDVFSMDRSRSNRN